MSEGNGGPAALREALGGLEASARGLDPGPEEREDLWGAVGAHVLGDLAELEHGPAYAAGEPIDPAVFELAETPAPLSTALATIKDVEQPGIHQASGRHFAYIPGGGLFPAALGDLLADVGNCYAGVHFAAPAASLMERSLVRWMAGLVGYSESAGGDLTSGASIANLEGIVTARDVMGISSADVTRSVVYLTSQTHHCVDKALRISGLSEAVVRRVPIDDRWRMHPDALETAVEADLAAGLRPWLVVATAGTTDTGAVDPLSAVADVADAYDLWLQVDAAYGGFFLLTEHGRRILVGIERSRSVTMDPHKGLFLPFGSGALIVRDEHQLAEAHRYGAGYLRDAREAGGTFSASDLSVELSRPFRGPRLWLPLKLFGLAPFRAALEEKLLLARYAHARLAELPSWAVGPEPDLSVVTFRYVPRRGDANAFNRLLLEAVLADGSVVVSATELDGSYTLRLAILHYRSHLDEVDRLLEVLAREAARLER
ncbi:MAG TPA: aminotransferase class V-fold PLP-dependent enzyme [Gaiellaceae bacterium]|nr:aminotransferase class V-fold PLP-dependent enzyme [Gaiellaceae bacterium]